MQSLRLMQCLYYIYGNRANFLSLGSRAFIISKERRYNKDLHGVGNFKIERVIGERREPHTYRTAAKNFVIYIYIYIYVFYIYIYIRPYVVHVPLTRVLRANVGPAG